MAQWFQPVVECMLLAWAQAKKKPWLTAQGIGQACIHLGMAAAWGAVGLYGQESPI